MLMTCDNGRNPADFVRCRYHEFTRIIMPCFFRFRRLLLAALFIACRLAAADGQAPLTLEAATQKVVQDNPDLAQTLATMPFLESVNHRYLGWDEESLAGRLIEALQAAGALREEDGWLVA